MLNLEPVLLRECPDLVVVPGDVNSTLAAALTARQVVFLSRTLRPVSEAGRTMPEEHNRVLTDHVAEFLLTPTRDADENLLAEGIDKRRIAFVGNTMIDSLRKYESTAGGHITGELGVERFVLVTLHRPGLVDHPDRFKPVMEALEEIAEECPVVYPMHPRSQRRLGRFGWRPRHVKLVKPLSYLRFICADDGRRRGTDRLGRHPGGEHRPRNSVLHLACQHRATNHGKGGDEHRAGRGGFGGREPLPPAQQTARRTTRRAGGLGWASCGTGAGRDRVALRVLNLGSVVRRDLIPARIALYIEHSPGLASAPDRVAGTTFHTAFALGSGHTCLASGAAALDCGRSRSQPGSAERADRGTARDGRVCRLWHLAPVRRVGFLGGPTGRIALYLPSPRVLTARGVRGWRTRPRRGRVLGASRRELARGTRPPRQSGVAPLSHIATDHRVERCTVRHPGLARRLAQSTSNSDLASGALLTAVDRARHRRKSRLYERIRAHLHR